MVYGHGVYDFDDNISNHQPFYGIWKEMIRRCYAKESLQKFPSYIGTVVCDEWKIFSNFEIWAVEHYKENYHLDKDIIAGDLKLYSPDTCEFVPLEINHCIKNKISSNDLPIGVSYRNKPKKMKNELSKPYITRISKYGKDIHIQYSSTPEEAHRAWQKEKISYFNELIETYSTEVSEKVIDGLKRRIEILQYDIDNSLITENVNKV